MITELRIPHEWSYQHVARLVGCDESHMLRIEHGTENPTLTLMQAIADLHKLKLSQLIARAERKHENCLKKKG